MSTARNVCFTLNNWKKAEVVAIKKWKYKYIVFAEEIGDSGTPHIQGYVEWPSSKKFTVMKRLNPRIHWESRKGTAAQAADYIRDPKPPKIKGVNLFEDGDISNQGERADLNKIKDEILAGKRVDDITIENPIIYHQYGRTLNKIEDLVMRKKFRTEMTQGIWLWGATYVGKSHAAFENYHPDTHYNVPKDGNWWDAYTQQETVIINDFRGEITYGEMLNLVDKWPHTVRRRNREPMPFTSKLVVVTSSLPPEEVYYNLAENDTLEQLLRRFVVTKMEPWKSEKAEVL